MVDIRSHNREAWDHQVEDRNPWTLPVEQQAARVWRVLGGVKTEFGKFGAVLERVRRQLDTASRTIEETGVRSRAMERRLRSVEQLPEQEASDILAPPQQEQEQDASSES